MRIRTVLLWIMIVAFGLAAALGVVAILAWSFGPAEERLIATALIVGAFSLSALLCVIVLDRFKMATLMSFGIAASALAMLGWLLVIWITPFVGPGGFALTDRLVKPAVTLTAFATWAAHLGMLVLPRVDWTVSRGVRFATIVFAALFAGGAVACVWVERFEVEEGRILGVILVLGLFGTVASPTLALVEALRRRSRPEDISSKVTMEIVCPRCGTRQRLGTGAKKCMSCRLAITMQVEEPKCRCGYLLYDLEGDTCPECGRSVTGAQQWGGPDVPPETPPEVPQKTPRKTPPEATQETPCD